MNVAVCMQMGDMDKAQAQKAYFYYMYDGIL